MLTNLKKFKSLFFLLTSFLIVAFGESAWIPWLGPLAACIGYAFFWRFLDETMPAKKRGFWWAAIWFAFVQTAQLSWMTSIRYQGLYILFVYAGLCLCFGCQFGLLTTVLRRRSVLSVSKILALASFWTLLEWGRLFVLCGFSFSFAGLSLASFTQPMQLAALGGILGLSFWVIFANGLALKALRENFSPKNYLLWLAVSLFPYLFGWIHLGHVGRQESKSEGSFHVALVQPALLPSQKVPLKKYLTEFVSPYEQWRQIYQFLQICKDKPIDMIALPEAVVPFGQDLMIYSLDKVKQVLAEEGIEERKWPPLEAPYAELKLGRWYVSNAFWVQLLANLYSAEVFVGLDAQDRKTRKNFNAAFHFKPEADGFSIERYEKRVLLPLAEVLPWRFLKIFSQAYGITDFFTPGVEAKVFSSKYQASPSICLEETYSELMREAREKGANLFINLTNDGWYPFSRLPLQHLTHGRLRAVENGVPLLRACNTGITAIVDSKGIILDRLGTNTKASQNEPGVLYSTLSSYQHKTLFSFWGDAGIVGISLLLIVWSLRPKEEGVVF